VPGWPWVPAIFLLFVVATSGFAVIRKPVESGIGLTTLLLGLGIWQITRREGQRSSP
jgi:hypothetical protein